MNRLFSQLEGPGKKPLERALRQLVINMLAFHSNTQNSLIFYSFSGLTNIPIRGHDIFSDSDQTVDNYYTVESLYNGQSAVTDNKTIPDLIPSLTL